MKKLSLSKKIIASGVFTILISTTAFIANAQDLQMNTQSRIHLPFLDKVMRKIDNKDHNQYRNSDKKKDKEDKDKKTNYKAVYGTVSSVGTNSFTLLVESKNWNNGTSSTTTKTYVVNVLSATKIFENSSSTIFTNINLNDKVLVKGTLNGTDTNIINANSIHLNEVKAKTKVETKVKTKHNNATVTATDTVITKYTLQERQDMFNKIVNYFKNLLGL